MRLEFLNILTLQINTSHNLEIVDYEHCQNDTQMGCIFSVSRPDHDSNRGSRKFAYTPIIMLITTCNSEIGLVFLHFNHDVMNIGELCTCIR